MADLYQTLNVPSTATTAEIQSAYHRERARIMADEPAGEAPTADRLATLDEAYATLTDATRRMAYDRSVGDNAIGTALVAASSPAAIVVPQTPAAPVLQQPCPHCGALNPLQATMCLQCGQQVSRPCPNCGQPVVLSQTVCARCNTFIPEYDQRRFGEAIKVEQQTQQVRQESEIRVEALEAGHQVRAQQGAIFWLIVTGLCIGVTVLFVILNAAK